MKKLFLAALLFISSIGFASAVTVSGSVGAESNYINKGVSLSHGNPSENAHLGVQLQNGLFVDGNLHTVDRAGNGKTRTDVGVGYRGEKLGLKYYTRVYRVEYTDGLHRSIADAAENTNAVDVGAEFQGVFADATKNFQVQGTGGKDLWYRVGYKFHPVSKLLVGAALTRKHFENQGVTVSRGAEAFATYALAKNIDVKAEYWTNVHAADGSRLGNQSSVGVALKF